MPLLTHEEAQPASKSTDIVPHSTSAPGFAHSSHAAAAVPDGMSDAKIEKATEATPKPAVQGLPESKPKLQLEPEPEQLSEPQLEPELAPGLEPQPEPDGARTAETAEPQPGEPRGDDCSRVVAMPGKFLPCAC